jgi:hypothetical protein
VSSPRALAGRIRRVTRWRGILFDAAPLALGLALGLGAGCTSDAKRVEQGRVANLAERIDRLRRAENADKRPLLEQLTRAECVSPDACALKDLCVRAYQLHQRGLDAIAALRHVAQRDAGASADVSSRLETADRDLAQARELAERCSEEQVRVVRKTLL